MQKIFWRYAIDRGLVRSPQLPSQGCSISVRQGEWLETQHPWPVTLVRLARHRSARRALAFDARVDTR